MKIITIGAGVAALVTAKKLCPKGFQVVAFEKNSYEDLCYDWTDDVCPDAFTEQTGLDLPTHRFRKSGWTFYSPDVKNPFKPTQNSDEQDWSVYRRDYSHELLSQIEGDFTVHFGEAVKKLIVENGRVVGVETDQRKEYADLVIDNSGALSPFRAQVPEKFKIEKKPGKNNVFYAYRGFFEYPEGVSRPEVHTNRVYLKHMGEPGISWCICGEKEVDVLIGRVVDFNQKSLDAAMEDMKSFCPEMGGKLVSAGKVYIIPVRHVLPRMVADGYVAIGDAAFMTIPFCGSGIHSSILASCILCDVLEKNPSSDASNLWEYQTKYYRYRGAQHCGDDVMKNWLLNDCTPEELNFAFGSGALIRDIVMNGTEVKIPVLKIIPKALKFLAKPKLVAGVLGMFIRNIGAIKVARRIPEKYDDAKIAKWEEKLAKFYK